MNLAVKSFRWDSRVTRRATLISVPIVFVCGNYLVSHVVRPPDIAALSARIPNLVIYKNRADQVRAISGRSGFYAPHLKRYWWLSKNDFLFYRESGLSDLQFFHYSTESRAEVHLKQLSSLINRLALKAPFMDADVSPDGRWIAWSDRNGLNRSRLDGTRLRQWPKLSSYSLYNYHIRWMNDSRHIVQVVNPLATKEKAATQDYGKVLDFACVHDGAKPGVALIPIERAPQLFRSTNPLSLNSILIGDTLVLEHLPPPHTCSLEGVQLETGGSGQLKQIGSFLYPAKLAAGESVSFSPDGTHVAWISRQPYVTNYSRLLSLFAGRLPDTGSYQELWICRTNGSDMRRLGRYDNGSEDDRARGNVLEDLDWTPDSLRLSFVLNGGLYTLPIN